MGSSYENLGKLLRDLRVERDIGQKEVVAALRFRYSARSLARAESGQHRPPRRVLIDILVNGLKVRDTQTINRVLSAAEFAQLTAEDCERHQLAMSDDVLLPMTADEQQKTTGGPNDGKPPGVTVKSAAGERFVPWKDLQPKIETHLQNQLDIHVPANCTVVLDDFRGRQNWVVRIVDAQGNRLGYVVLVRKRSG